MMRTWRDRWKVHKTSRGLNLALCRGITSRKSSVGDSFNRFWSVETIANLRRALHRISSSTDMLSGLPVLRSSIRSPLTHFLSTMAVCLIPAAVGAQGQIAMFPNLDAKHGVGLPINNYTRMMLEGLEGTGVSVVTPYEGMTVKVDLGAVAIGFSDGVHNVLRDGVVSGKISGDDIAVFIMANQFPAAQQRSAVLDGQASSPDLHGASTAMRFVDGGELDIIRQPYAGLGNGLRAGSPSLNLDSTNFRWMGGLPLYVGGVLYASDQSLPGLSYQENIEFLELKKRFKQLDVVELRRLYQLLEQGITVPVGTTPIAPPNGPDPDPELLICHDGSKLPLYCKYYKEWRPTECTCD